LPVLTVCLTLIKISEFFSGYFGYVDMTPSQFEQRFRVAECGQQDQEERRPLAKSALAFRDQRRKACREDKKKNYCIDQTIFLGS
jgi:hypothetical protein